MLNLFFALIQAVAGQASEPQFTLGNTITIVVVILTGAAIVIRSEAKTNALSDAVKDHIEDDKLAFGELRVIMREHESNPDQHMSKRLFDELIRRLDAADAARERMELKLDAVVRQTK